MRNKMKINEISGITLIALVITIIILLILAGVSIAMLAGEGGILNKAKIAAETNNEKQAKEKLELALLNARTEKETNSSYDSNTFLEKLLDIENIVLEGEIAIVDNYNFVIDREKLIILENLGEIPIQISKEVLAYKGKNAKGQYEVNLLLIVESSEEIKKVTIIKPDGTTEDMTEEEIQKGKNMSVELDAEYFVTVTTNNEKNGTRKVVEESEENINSIEEMITFRDKVNKGLTYEGKTIKLTNDIDLSKVCYKVDGTVANDVSWEPIGNWGTDDTHMFSGKFDGQNHVINNLYINTTKSNQGLFGRIDSSAEVSRCIVKGTMSGGKSIGGIVRMLSRRKNTVLC